MASSLGIDIGTTSISFAVVDGNEVIYTSSSCNSSALKENNDYQNADIIFETVKDETDKILKNYKIESIGFTGQMHGIVYTDDNGLAVSPLYTWKTQTGNLIYKDGYTFCDYIFCDFCSVSSAPSCDFLSGVALLCYRDAFSCMGLQKVCSKA